MSLFTHAPAPWRHVLGHDTHAVKRDSAGRMLGTVTMPLEDYDHACACVNALAGMDPAGVAGVVEALGQIIGWHDAPPAPGSTAWHEAIVLRLDDARAALRALRNA